MGIFRKAEISFVGISKENILISLAFINMCSISIKNKLRRKEPTVEERREDRL